MVIRRYVVKDMPEALVLIRRDLGKDAVILSTKRIRIKKWKGLWRTKSIEVLAVSGADVPVQTSASEGQSSRPPATTPTLPSSSVLISNVDRSPSDFDKLYTELHELKQFVAGALTNQVPFSVPGMNGPVSMASWHQVSELLRMQGMSEEQAKSLVHKCALHARNDLLSADLEAFDATRQRQLLMSQLFDSLAALREPQPITPSSRVVAFVGPTGVGKTTTIAKLAAMQVLSGNRKVAFITTDTFRIAAVEQLRTYAGILNVPLQVIHEQGELQTAIAKLSDRDLIFVDTAGRNFMDRKHVDDVKHLVSGGHIDETYLVLSMTSKQSDLEKLASLFEEVPIDKYLFTKMDETSSYGAIIELLMTHQKPLSYITTGQNVPDDIEVASLEKLLDKVLGGGAA